MWPRLKKIYLFFLLSKANILFSIHMKTNTFYLIFFQYSDKIKKIKKKLLSFNNENYKFSKTKMDFRQIRREKLNFKFQASFS